MLAVIVTLQRMRTMARSLSTLTTSPTGPPWSPIWERYLLPRHGSLTCLFTTTSAHPYADGRDLPSPRLVPPPDQRLQALSQTFQAMQSQRQSLSQFSSKHRLYQLGATPSAPTTSGDANSKGGIASMFLKAAGGDKQKKAGGLVRTRVSGGWVI